MNKRKSQPWLSQIGGIIAMICFFLPWASCRGEDIATGADMGGIAWLVLVAAGTITASVHYFKSEGSLSKARPIVVGSAIVAIAILIFRYFVARDEFGDLLKVEYGGFGSLGSFLLALYGSLFLNDEP